MDSNDAMYGSDPKFLADVKSVGDTLLNQILSHLKTLSSPEASNMFCTIFFPGQVTVENINVCTL